jgi:hypothetical protein
MSTNVARNGAIFAVSKCPSETVHGGGLVDHGARPHLRQLHPENLSTMSEQVTGGPSGHAALPSFHARPEEEATAPEIIKRLQVQKVDERAPLPGGRSIPMLPLRPISWRRGVHV